MVICKHRLIICLDLLVRWAEWLYTYIVTYYSCCPLGHFEEVGRSRKRSINIQGAAEALPASHRSLPPGLGKVKAPSWSADLVESLELGVYTTSRRGISSRSPTADLSLSLSPSVQAPVSDSTLERIKRLSQPFVS